MNRTITKVIDPVWGDESHTFILCHVAIAEHIQLNEPPGFMYEFTCTATDSELHGQQLWADLNAGKYGEISAYVAPPKPPTSGPRVIA